MTSVTTKLEATQPPTETASHLFDDWFDPIEAGIRDRAREFIEEMIRGESGVSPRPLRSPIRHISAGASAGSGSPEPI
jgi:putative transposase